MTRLEHMRLYRSHLTNEVRTLADRYITATGTSPDNCPSVRGRIDVIQLRMRPLNDEIDKLMAIQLGRKDAQNGVPAFARA